MAFPGSPSKGLQKSTPILVTTSTSIAVPPNAKFVHAYIVGGGGGGGAAANTAGTAVTSSAGGGGGGAAYIGVDLDQWQLFGDFSSRNSRAIITATIGSGGTGQTRTTAGGSPGGTGGTTTFAISGGFSLSVSGGAAGNQSPAAAGSITPSTSYGVLAAYGARGPILLRPLMAFPPQHSSTNFSGDSTTGIEGAGATPTGGSVTTTVSSEVGNNGGALSTFVLIPWWLQSVGLTRGSGGTGIALTGTGRAAGGGGSGFGGNGGNGAASNTAGTVTGGNGGGYGAGGGGAAGVTGSTVTSGSGAPGCCVILFELEV